VFADRRGLPQRSAYLSRLDALRRAGETVRVPLAEVVLQLRRFRRADLLLRAKCVSFDIDLIDDFAETYKRSSDLSLFLSLSILSSLTWQSNKIFRTLFTSTRVLFSWRLQMRTRAFVRQRCCYSSVDFIASCRLYGTILHEGMQACRRGLTRLYKDHDKSLRFLSYRRNQIAMKTNARSTRDAKQSLVFKQKDKC